MRGTDKTTGKELDGKAHLRQSITDILNTRIGTRVMRRDYGSELPNLIDNPINDEFAVDLYVALAEALDKWEPRLKLREASMTVQGDGVIEFALTGDYLPDGKTITLDGIVVR
ncbi:GPW/gp25 family protein [Rhizobium sp. 1AS11]|jgi:phage baseplate assembly protein W|uniref:GPW/gp25 family protein n=1 Tax=Rhizobium acaciae TaxID=2989736 RepID=UPI0022233A4B|nr:GPW/gp25 family protein [Rhizobium acaciae]MCW1412209.1 GPW/gp25 family protein [Rhizobium acaciae]MCW1744224.1 GPW/gp25 family protein [Rhizobium acaciae]